MEKSKCGNLSAKRVIKTRLVDSIQIELYAHKCKSQLARGLFTPNQAPYSIDQQSDPRLFIIPISIV